MGRVGGMCSGATSSGGLLRLLWSKTMYPAWCRIPCSGANCGPGKAHQCYRTQCGCVLLLLFRHLLDGGATVYAITVRIKRRAGSYSSALLFVPDVPMQRAFVRPSCALRARRLQVRFDRICFRAPLEQK